MKPLFHKPDHPENAEAGRLPRHVVYPVLLVLGLASWVGIAYGAMALVQWL